MDRNEQARQNYALAATQHNALNAAVRNLAGNVNQHTLLLAALMKKLNVTPDELIATLVPEDFIHPEDTKLIEEPSGN